MTTKKKLGTKLAHSVRQVKTQREESSTAPATAEKPANKSAASRAAKTTDKKGFRPNRVWPD